MMRILIIEDDSTWPELLQIYLPDVSLEVAERLQDAIEKLCREEFDLVIYDPGLPDNTSGLAGYQKIREFRTDVPIVAFSGADDGVLAEALSKEGTSFVRKDIIVQAPGVLMTILESAIKGFKGMATSSRILNGQT